VTDQSADQNASAVTPALEKEALCPPDLDTLIEWMDEGGCEADCPHGCWVEPDGTCPHGHPSWLIILGMI
jgi:hypothetical protein